ncbi:hypothetical protein NMG60_11021861, partial [Bertholletia excelsa]
RLADINPRSFYTPCGCRNINLRLCDMTNSCTKSTSFFRVVPDNIPNLIPKSLSQTLWQSHIESIKVIRFLTPQIRDVFIEIQEIIKDAKTKSEANYLATYELENYEFLLCMTMWYDILFVINLISKFYNQKICLFDVAIDELKGFLSFI